MLTPSAEPKKDSGRNSQPGQRSDKKNDLWAENIHLRKVHEDPSVPVRLAQHNKTIDEANKFIDFVHHTENQRRQAF